MRFRGNGKSTQRKGVGYVIAIGLVVVYLGGWIGAAYALDTQRPVTIVSGISMYPTLKNGDLVILKGLPPKQLAEDYANGIHHIIVFSTREPPHNFFFNNGGKFIIHRIYEVVYDSNSQLVGFVTKGDNNPVVDPGVATPDRIMGTVVAGPFPYVGSVFLFLQSPLGFSIIIILIILLIAWNFIGEKAKNKSKPAPLDIQEHATKP